MILENTAYEEEVIERQRSCKNAVK